MRRRDLLAGFATLVASPSAWAQEEIAFIPILEKIGEAALSYLAGKALGEATGTITNEDVIKAVNQSAEETRRYVVANVQRMFDENAVKTIIGFIEAGNIALRDYARTRERDTLTVAYQSNTNALGFAKSFGFPGVPSFVLALYQRAFVMKARSEAANNLGQLRLYAQEIESFGKPYVDETIKAFLDELSPGKRLGDMSCSPRPDDSWRLERGGQGFHVAAPDEVCVADLDRRPIVIEQDKYYNGDDWDKVHGIALRNYSSKVAEIKFYQDETRRKFDKFLKPTDDLLIRLTASAKRA